MLYICIPVHNEAPTIGVLLWKIRGIFQDYAREYELLVFNDGSSDSTAAVLEGYASVLPLTILSSEQPVGYAAAMGQLLRAASDRTKYARRDAVITMQGDFTDAPDRIPEFVKRFEGGADIVVGEDNAAPQSRPREIQKLRRWAPWALKAFVQTPGIRDPFSAFRLYRVSVLREAFKQAGSAPLVRSAGWSANVDLLLTLAPHARRIETVQMEPRYDLRQRTTRIRPFAEAWSLFSFGRSARGRSLRAPAEREAS